MEEWGFLETVLLTVSMFLNRFLTAFHDHPAPPFSTHAPSKSRRSGSCQMRWESSALVPPRPLPTLERMGRTVLCSALSETL